MNNFVEQYQDLELGVLNYLRSFILANGVKLENHTGLVIDLNTDIFQFNTDLGKLRDYDFIDSDLNLHIDNISINIITLPLENIASLCDTIKNDWKRDELIRVYASNIMERGEKERIYTSLENAFTEINDDEFTGYHELRVQKWVNDDWEDVVPTKIEIFNKVEDKTIYFGDNDGAVKLLKRIIIEDNDGDESIDSDVLEHDDATILMHHVKRNNDNINITYLTIE